MTSPQAAADFERASGQQAEDALYYRRVLHDLIDMGSDLARGVHRLATGAPAQNSEAGAGAADLTVAFDRIARCVRRSVVLARSLAEPAAVQTETAPQRTETRARIIREVEDVIYRNREGAESESLNAELLERLDGPDLDDSLDDRPAAEIIAEICRDLGVGAPRGKHVWKRRTPADVAALRARAARQAPAVVRLAVASAAIGSSEGVAPAIEREERATEAAAPTVVVRGDGSCYPTFVEARALDQTGSRPPFRHVLHGT